MIKNVTLCRGHNSVPYRHQLHRLCQKSLEDSAISTAQRFKGLDELGSFQRIKIILKGGEGETDSLPKSAAEFTKVDKSMQNIFCKNNHTLGSKAFAIQSWVSPGQLCSSQWKPVRVLGLPEYEHCQSLIMKFVALYGRMQRKNQSQDQMGRKREAQIYCKRSFESLHTHDRFYSISYHQKWNLILLLTLKSLLTFKKFPSLTIFNLLYLGWSLKTIYLDKIHNFIFRKLIVQESAYVVLFSWFRLTE